MNWWQVTLIILGMSLFVALSMAYITGKFTSSKHLCRCAHFRQAHKGPNTECYGYKRDGMNAAGVQQWRSCTCKAFRPTEHSRWRRLWEDTEEHSA